MNVSHRHLEGQAKSPHLSWGPPTISANPVSIHRDGVPAFSPGHAGALGGGVHLYLHHHLHWRALPHHAQVRLCLGPRREVPWVGRVGEGGLTQSWFVPCVSQGCPGGS